jgi:hypothetical protein
VEAVSDDLARMRREARAEALRDAADHIGRAGVIDAAGLRRLAEFAMEDGPEPRQPLELLDPVLERFQDTVLRSSSDDPIWDLWRAIVQLRHPNSAPVA